MCNILFLQYDCKKEVKICDIKSIEIAKFYDDHQAAISFTWDDAGVDQGVIASVFDSLNLNATFFPQTITLVSYPTLKDKYKKMYHHIFTSGHEIGNHTYSHADLSKISSQDSIDFEINYSKNILSSIVESDAIYSFAFPYSHLNKNLLKKVLETHLFCRNDYTDPYVGKLDNIKLINMGARPENEMLDSIKSGIRNKKWMITLGHGIDNLGYEAIKSNDLYSILSFLKKDNEIWVCKFWEGALYYELYHNTKININNNTKTILLSAPNYIICSNLPQIPITLKISLNKNYENVSFSGSSIINYKEVSTNQFIVNIDLKKGNSIDLSSRSLE